MICIVVAYPVNYHPFRQNFFMAVYGREKFSNKENLLFTILFISLTTVISITYPKIKPVISLMGGLISVSMCYLVPMICKLKLGKEKWYSFGNISAIIFFGILIMSGYISVGITIYQMIKGIDVMPRNKHQRQ